MKKIETVVSEKRDEVLMPEQDRKLLKDLYLIRCYSGYEEPLRQAITAFLDSHQIPYINYNGNILGFNHPGAPLFSAHMDMVNTEGYKLRSGENTVGGDYAFTIDSRTNIRLYRDRDKKNQTSLGADDKNGVWVILEMLAHGKEINFAFCHSEEIGGAGSTQVVSDAELGAFIASCKYCVVIDRRNANDIIGYDNQYCLAFDDRLTAFASENGFGYRPATGSISDANRFSQLVESVNLSCGYYEPHTSREYTNLNELWNTLLFCEKMVDDFVYHSVSAGRMQSFKKCSSPYTIYKTYSSPAKKEESSDNISASLKKKTKKTLNELGGLSTAQSMKADTKPHTIMSFNQTDDGYDLDFESIEALLAEAIDLGAVFVEDENTFYIPLYDDETANKYGILPSQVLTYVACSICTESLSIAQESLDTLYGEWYHKQKAKVLGICTTCGEIQDVTGMLRYLC